MFPYRRDDTNQPERSEDEYPYFQISMPENRPRWREAPVWREATREEEAEFERKRDAVLRRMAEEWGEAALPPPLDAAEMERRKQVIRDFFVPRQQPPTPTQTGRDAGGTRAPSPTTPASRETGATSAPPSPAQAGQSPALQAEQPLAVHPVGVAPASLPGTDAPPAPVFLRVAEAPPTLERPLKRQPPTLGKIAPFPTPAPGTPTGEWAARWASLTTADDPLYVLRVGLNAILELRLSQQPARLSPQALTMTVPPLEPEALLSWPTERLLAWLDMESALLLRALETPLPRFPGWAREALEEFRQQLLGKREQRLAALVGVLRKRLQKRRAVRQLGELVTRLAWQTVDTPALLAGEKDTETVM